MPSATDRTVLQRLGACGMPLGREGLASQETGVKAGTI